MPLMIDPEWFQEPDLPALRWLRRAMVTGRATLEADASVLLAGVASSRAFADVWQALLRALDGDVDPLRARLSALGAHAARSGIELRAIGEAMQLVRRRMVHLLIAGYGHEPELLEAVLAVMQRLFDRGLWTITREYLLHREAQMEDQRRREVREHQRAEYLRLRSVELEAENRRIREVSRLKSEFLANMSHELRTPLNSIIGFSDLLYDQEVPASEQREVLSDILRSARHLLKLINDVLDLAKVEAGKLEFRPEEVQLAPLMQEVCDALRQLANDSQVSVQVDVDSNIDSVWIDPARLRQVLYNYLSNALKFTPPGGHVVVRAQLDAEQRLLLEVEDDGVGVAPQDLKRLFMEFEQLSGGRSGTGLGLSLTRRIVQAQGGDVGVRSEPGSGSTFWARWPAVLPGERTSRPSSYFEQLRPTGTHAALSDRDSLEDLQRSGT